MPGIPKAKLDEWRALAAEEAAASGCSGVDPIPNGHGAVRCRRCGAVLLPGTEAYDWHGSSPAYACERPVPRAYREAVPALLDEVEAARSLLREIEWCGEPEAGHGQPNDFEQAPNGSPYCWCTYCGAPASKGHDPGCRLAAFLK